jgi:AMP deaminase
VFDARDHKEQMKQTGVYKLAKWAQDNKLLHKHRVQADNGNAPKRFMWMLQIPRKHFEKEIKAKSVTTFAEWLDNLFRPLFLATLHPEDYPEVYDLLLNIVGFDSIDDESRIDTMISTVSPDKWTKDNGCPPYSYFGYYFWANIYQLNLLSNTKVTCV